MTTVRRYFEKHARGFDRSYGRRRRPTVRRLALATSVVARHADPSVLDVGCGPGRVAEAVLDAGAASYVGVDLSAQMLALARARLDGSPAVELVEGDFMSLELDRTFDVVIALGMFDYLRDPAAAAAWMRARCASALVASFPRWNWVKGPVRHVRYELLYRVPIFDYAEADAEALLGAAGFSRVEFPFCGRYGFLVEAAP